MKWTFWYVGENKYNSMSVGNEIISPTTVMHKVRQEELKVEIQNEKRQIKRLYIEADEDHVSERGNKV